MKIINSLDNKTIKLAASLKEARARKRNRLFLVDGLREVELALKSNYKPKFLFFSQEIVKKSTEKNKEILNNFINKNSEIINVSKNKFKESYHFNITDLNDLEIQIEIQLAKIIKDILDHPEMIKPKAQNALNRIKQEHDPALYSEKLNAIYNKIEK